MAIAPVEVRPIVPPAGSAINFGVEITNLDLEDLSDSDFNVIRDALFTEQVVLIKNQSHLSPKAQFLLTQRFDPEATSYGHGKTLDAKKSILHPDLKTVPHQPQVQVIGHGHWDSYEGLENFNLKHPHHKTFHKTQIPDEEDKDFTRFYRWHIDAALYDLNAPVVTSLLAVHLPTPRTQTLRYDDGTGQEMAVPLGTTAFVSGETMYELLSPADQEFVRTSFIEYAPHPYIWMSKCKSRPDGLGLFSEGLELADSSLPPIDASKIKILPMVWKNPVTGKLAVQMHPSAVKAIHLADGSKITDLETVRAVVHRLQRPGIAPERVYAHDWVEGDVVLFHNRGVLHSVVGAFDDAAGERRLFRQCNVAASEGVMGADGEVY
jgi:alpha-ketoglutarate-dependent taurine dioxygenase